LGLCAHALNGVHDVRLLGQERISQIRRPLDIARHPLHHVWKCRHCLDTRVPWLPGHRVRQRLVLQVLVIRVPLLKLNHFQRIGGSSQGLGKKRIGIKGNRRHQGIQLVGWNRRRHLIGGRRDWRLALLRVRQ
jgi:hypothetical protein